MQRQFVKIMCCQNAPCCREVEGCLPPQQLCPRTLQGSAPAPRCPMGVPQPPALCPQCSWVSRAALVRQHPTPQETFLGIAITKSKLLLQYFNACVAPTLSENLPFEEIIIYFTKKLIQQFSIMHVRLNNKNTASTFGFFPLLQLFIFRVKWRFKNGVL